MREWVGRERPVTRNNVRHDTKRTATLLNAPRHLDGVLESKVRSGTTNTASGATTFISGRCSGWESSTRDEHIFYEPVTRPVYSWLELLTQGMDAKSFWSLTGGTHYKRANPAR